MPAPFGDHVVDVIIELTPRLQHDRFLLGEVAVEADDLEDVVGPPGELLPVLGRRAEQCADDRNRVGTGDVGDEFATARGDDVVDEFVDDGVDGVVHARCRAGCERP